MLRRRLALLLIGLSLTLLAGCSGLRLVESQVRSSTPADAPPIETDARYRFEWLPSQNDPVETDSIQAIAEAELTAVGLVHDDQAARYSVQITASMESYAQDDWGWPYGGRVHSSIYIGGGIYRHGPGGLWGLGPRYPPTLRYRHKVRLLLRDLHTQQVVYETQATHEGPWSDRYNILRATLAAALTDFPKPTSGARRVKVEIPR